MKFICQNCGCIAPCVLDVGELRIVEPKDLGCVLKNRACKWERAPKLAVEIFDHPDCPKTAQYAVVTSSGVGMWLDVKPNAKENVGSWGVAADAKVVRIPGLFDNYNWQNSLIERPKKEAGFPDWCKIGNSVWWHDEYWKITNILDNSDGHILSIHKTWLIHAEKGASGVSGAIHDFKEARLRPWRFEEARQFIGQTVVSKQYKSTLLILQVTEDGFVYAGVSQLGRSFEEMLNNFEMTDGSPCGVYEHFDDNKEEWVR